MNYNDIVKEFIEIEEAHILVNTFEIYIGEQAIKIIILKDLKNGRFSYANSHNYQGASQSSPYMSSACSMISTEEEALERALNELTHFYDGNDHDALWIKNEDF